MDGWRLQSKQDPVNQLGFRETGLVGLSHVEDGSWKGKGDGTVVGCTLGQAADRMLNKLLSRAGIFM